MDTEQLNELTGPMSFWDYTCYIIQQPDVLIAVVVIIILIGIRYTT